MFKLLKTCEEVEAHHEYLCEYVQQLAVLRFANKISSRDAVEAIQKTYGVAVALSEHPYWVDSSNKLTWLIPELLTVFPEARFVNIVRDGRKVSGSFFRKLSHEMYDDRSVSLLSRWLRDPENNLMPPPEKRYWWNIPLNDQPFAEEFDSFNQFERCVYHWTESNRVAKAACDTVIPLGQSFTVKLEELVNSIAAQNDLVSFIGITFRSEFSKLLNRPENVIVPLDLRLSPSQSEQFCRIGSDMMRLLGYSLDSEEYRVDYR